MNGETPSDRARVLVVDDDPTFGGLIADLLRDKGHEVVLCAAPADALDRAKGVRFQAAVVDLVMPGMGGLELAEQL